MSRTRKNQTIADSKVRIEDVAEAVGVSIMSVSRAMRGVEGISATKRAEILKTARNMGYYPNRVAVSLAASSSNLIGVSVPTLFGTVFSEIYDGMRSSFDKAGFATMIDITDYSREHEEAWVERMISWQPAGLILSGVHHSKRTLESLSKSNIPVLEIWDVTEDPIDLCVGVDHRIAGQEMGQYLVGLGYRRAAYVGVASGRDPPAEQRFAGLGESFFAQKLEFIGEERSSPDSSFESGYKATLKLLSKLDQLPDVLCFLNDNMAFGGVMACEEMGLECPLEIGIVGYNGFNINSVLHQKITTSVTPRRSMGEHGARLLIGRILGAKTRTITRLKVKIVPGQTTRSLTASLLDKS